MNPSQQHYLQVSGIERWVRRSQPSTSPIKLMVVSEKKLSDHAKILFAAMLNCIGLTDSDAHITTISTDITQHISQKKPQLFIIFDEVSCQVLLKTTSKIEDLRNNIHAALDEKWPAIVTFHPDYLLKNPLEKKKAYADLQQIQRFLHEK